VSGGRIEIITGRERRRRWSLDEKLRIVAETDEAGVRVSEVAARHGVYPGLLFTWRRQVRDGLLVAPPSAMFAPVRLLAAESEAEPEVRRASHGELSPPAAETSGRGGMIEIILANGCRLRVDQQIDVRALWRIVGVLHG
jgi:transposase